MYIHGAILDKYMVSPDLIEQLRTRMDPFGVSHEKMQQSEFSRPQRDFAILGGDTMSGRVEPQSANFDDIVQPLPASAAAALP